MKRALAALSAAALLFSASLLPQDAPPDPFLHWTDQIAQRELQQRQREIDQIQTVAEADRRKQAVRAKLLESIAGLPDYRGPLNARVTGTIQANGYTIEKLIYTGLPNFYVTANLDRPTTWTSCSSRVLVGVGAAGHHGSKYSLCGQTP